MVFNSLVFLCIFLPIVFLGHTILPGIRAKNAMLLVLKLAVFMPVSVNAAPKTNQWVNKGRYRYYYNQKGKKVKNKVKQIGNFRNSFDKKGRMQTGWQIFGSKKAYFSKKSGRMQVNKKVDGVKIGKSGYVKLSKTELKEQKALEKAKQILDKITTSKMSASGDARHPDRTCL